MNVGMSEGFIFYGGLQILAVGRIREEYGNVRGPHGLRRMVTYQNEGPDGLETGRIPKLKHARTDAHAIA